MNERAGHQMDTNDEYTKTMMACRHMAIELRECLTKLNPNPTRAEAFSIVRSQFIENAALGLALLSRGLASSYRNFNVGTVFIGLRPVTEPGKSPWYVYFAANTKQQDGEKYCGEQRLLDAAFKKQVRHIIAIYVAGEPQIDHGSGKKSEALTPCEVCRWRFRGVMREKNAIIGRDTLVIACHCYKPDVREPHTIASLHEFHCEPLD